MPDEFVEFGRDWERLHPDWTVRTWSESDLGWMRNLDVFTDAPLLSSRSNVARCEILFREGGVYVDCDVEPLRNIEPLLEGATFVIAYATADLHGNSFIASVPGHPILERVLTEFPISHYSQPEAISPQRTGPNLLTRSIRRTPDPDGTVRVLPRELATPYTWDQDHLRHARFDQAYMAHHWEKSWVRSPKQRLSIATMRRNVRALGALLLRPWAKRPPERTTVGLGDNRVLVETAYGFQILAFADDLAATPLLVRQGSHDPAFAEFLKRELRAGDVVVDVGANIGTVTIHAARHIAATGRVLAFEPNPDCFALLADSIYLNRMQGRVRAQIDIANVAVGAAAGVVELHVPTHHRGRASLSKENVPDSDQSVHAVEMVALDSVLLAIPEIRIVKIDVEGAELGVLQGLRQTLLERRVRLLDLELDDVLAGADWDELIALLRDLASTASSTFAINDDGTRRPMSVDAASHKDDLSHFVLAFE